MAAVAGKKTTGRQKITIQKIENEEDRLIAFSKRRLGIYKKANELVTLCGAEAAILVFSQAGRAFHFGSPSIDSIADRFLNQTMSSMVTNPLEEPLRRFEKIHRSAKINDRNQRHNEVIEQLDVFKVRQDELRKNMMTKNKAQLDWWEIPVGEMNYDQLQVTEFLLGKVATTLNEKLEKMKFGSPLTASSGPNLGCASGGI